MMTKRQNNVPCTICFCLLLFLFFSNLVYLGKSFFVFSRWKLGFFFFCSTGSLFFTIIKKPISSSTFWVHYLHKNRISQWDAYRSGRARQVFNLTSHGCKHITHVTHVTCLEKVFIPLDVSLFLMLLQINSDQRRTFIFQQDTDPKHERNGLKTTMLILWSGLVKETYPRSPYLCE